MTKILTKILAMLIIAITMLNFCAAEVKAVIEISTEKVYVETIGTVTNHLKYLRVSTGEYVYYRTIPAGYKAEDGTIYPAYCIDRDKPGNEEGGYYVTTENILNNNKIWRIIKNGYPYKTAEYWGLENDWDLYAVTKFAIYCVLGQTELDYFYAEKNDSEAQAMLKALKELVDIGENGTETLDTAPLSIEKVGNFEESGEYYIQEYEVNSTVEFNEYEITKITGLPTGAMIVDEDGKEKTTFSSGENFFIKVPKSQLTNDLNIKVDISAECKVYLIMDGESTVSGMQDYAIVIGEYSTITTSVTFKQSVNTGKIKIAKTDADDGEAIEGVEFTLLDSDGKEVATAVTDSKGIAQFTGLVQGNYTVIESSTTEKYIILEDSYDVEVEYNKTTSIGIENEKKKGNLQIYKVDKDNNNVILGSVQFDLYSEDEGEVIGTYTTDENGEIYIEDLPIGNYKIIETTTNKWYNLADEINVEINWDETTVATIENELKKGQVKVIKVDSENNEIKIEGAKFNVLDKNGNILETITTDSNGEATTSKYVIRDCDTIYLQEIETNEKYVLNDEIIEVNLTANEVEEITIENEKIKGQIKIVKTAENDNEITGDLAGTALEGVEFEVYDENNNLLETLVTDESGTAITSLLEKGTYSIKEVSTAEWYYLNQNIYSATIETNNQIVELSITNESQNPGIDTEKIGQDEAEIGSEIEYDISIQNTGNTTLDNVTWIDKIPSDCIKVTKFKTGTYNQSLQYNLYYKTNLSNDEYILLMEGLNSTENYEVDFEYELADNEYVTEIKLEFGTVDIGFCSNENPHLTAVIKDTVKSETTFENTATISGNFNGYEVTDSSKWKTFAYKLLPKTGF